MLFNKATACPPLVLTIPFGIPVVPDVCKIYNVNVIDIVDITRQVNNRPELLARDSLHPSGLMYGIWAKKMLDEWKI